MSDDLIHDDELIDCGLTQSQQQAFNELRFFAELHEQGVRSVAGISTRPYPLIVGPSGSGKTFLVRKLAVDQSVKMFSVNAQDWIPIGARNEGGHTLTQILRFIGTHPRGIVFIDEVNKLTMHHASESSWCADVLSEILAFLDMDVRLEPAGFSPDQIDHLDENFFIVGGGAFQAEWHGTKTREIGFSERPVTETAEKYRRAVQSQTQVADELLFRFSDQLIAIAPPTAGEFVERIQTVREALCMPALEEAELGAVVGEALESGRMMRWLEGYVVQCMARTPDGIRLGASLLENQSVRLADPSEFVPATDSTNLTKAAQKKVYCAAYDKYHGALRDLEPAAVAAEFALAELLQVARDRDESRNDRALFLVLCDARTIFRETLGDSEASLIGGMRWLADHVGLVVGAKSDEDRCARAKDVDLVSDALKCGIVRLRGCMDGSDVAPWVRPALFEFIVAAQRVRVAWQALAEIVVELE